MGPSSAFCEPREGRDRSPCCSTSVLHAQSACASAGRRSRPQRRTRGGIGARRSKSPAGATPSRGVPRNPDGRRHRPRNPSFTKSHSTQTIGNRRSVQHDHDYQDRHRGPQCSAPPPPRLRGHLTTRGQSHHPPGCRARVLRRSLRHPIPTHSPGPRRPKTPAGAGRRSTSVRRDRNSSLSEALPSAEPMRTASARRLRPAGVAAGRCSLCRGHQKNNTWVTAPTRPCRPTGSCTFGIVIAF